MAFYELGHSKEKSPQTFNIGYKCWKHELTYKEKSHGHLSMVRLAFLL